MRKPFKHQLSRGLGPTHLAEKAVEDWRNCSRGNNPIGTYCTLNCLGSHVLRAVVTGIRNALAKERARQKRQTKARHQGKREAK